MQIEQYAGALLVGSDTKRYWFDVTEEDRLVCCAEIHGIGTEREYADEISIDVEAVEALRADGYEGDIYDLRGRSL